MENTIVAGSLDNWIYFFDRNGKLLWSHKTGGEVWSVAISQDGNYIVAGSDDCKIYFFDKSGNLLWSYKTGEAVGQVAVTQDGNYVVAGCEDYCVCFFDSEITPAGTQIPWHFGVIILVVVLAVYMRRRAVKAGYERKKKELTERLEKLLK